MEQAGLSLTAIEGVGSAVGAADAWRMQLLQALVVEDAHVVNAPHMRALQQISASILLDLKVFRSFLKNSSHTHRARWVPPKESKDIVCLFSAKDEAHPEWLEHAAAGRRTLINRAGCPVLGTVSGVVIAALATVRILFDGGEPREHGLDRTDTVLGQGRAFHQKNSHQTEEELVVVLPWHLKVR
eukprot:SAG31_NODE_4768_length_2967_cov_4.361227_5_plen_185_part_00